LLINTVPLLPCASSSARSPSSPHPTIAPRWAIAPLLRARDSWGEANHTRFPPAGSPPRFADRIACSMRWRSEKFLAGFSRDWFGQDCVGWALTYLERPRRRAWNRAERIGFWGRVQFECPVRHSSRFC
jgi:hypothetical protein